MRESGLDLQRSDLRDAAVLVRTELRAQVRKTRDDTRQLVAITLTALAFGVGFPLVASGGTLAFGRALASGDPPVGTIGAALTGVAVVAAYFGSATAINQNRVGDVGPLLRTSVPPAAVSLGRFVTEVLQSVAFLLPAGLAVLALLAVGSGGPVVPLLGLAAAVPVFCLGVLAGRLLGVLLVAGYRRLGVSTWAKALTIVAVTAVAFVGTQSFMSSLFEDSMDGPAASIPPLLPGRPLQDYGQVFAAPLGADPGLVGAVLVAAVLAAVPLLLAATLKVETATLVRESDGSGESAAASGSRGVPAVFDRSTSARVAWRHLLRTRRDPRTLSHLFPFVFGLFGFAGTTASDPDFLYAIGPGAAVVAGVVLAGAAFCLNPLGDDRDQLPLLLTSTRSVAPLLRGRALAGLALAAPIVVAGAALALVEYSVALAVALVPFALFAATASACVALGTGALFPAFEASEYMNVERAHPSMLVTMGHFVGGMLFAGAGVFLLVITVEGGGLDLVLLGGWLGYLAVAGAGAGIGYTYAVRRFDGFSLDDV